MEQPNIQPGLSGIDKLAQTPATKAQDESKANGPAFQALLERIQSQAQEIKESSKTLADPSALNEAVDKARASLDDAQSLGNSLLEAFREAQQQDASNPSQPKERDQ